MGNTAGSAGGAALHAAGQPHRRHLHRRQEAAHAGPQAPHTGERPQGQHLETQGRRPAHIHVIYEVH